MKRKSTDTAEINETAAEMWETSEVPETNSKDVNLGNENKKKEENAKKYIYLGASLPDHSLKENTVFDGTFEEIRLFLQAEITKYPLIKELLVPVERLAETEKGSRISGLKKELIKTFERGD